MRILHQTRLSAGLSKQKLANLAGTSVPAVRLCETGRGRISTFQALVTEMGTSFIWPAYNPTMSLGENPRARRRKTGRSQRDVVAAIRVSKNTIIAMEATSRGRVETLSMLLRVLRVRPWLVALGDLTNSMGTRKTRLIPAQNNAEADRDFLTLHCH